MDSDDEMEAIVSGSNKNGLSEVAEAPGSPVSRAATTVVESDSEDVETTEERLRSMLATVRHETEDLIGSGSPKKREERVAILVGQLRKLYPDSPEVLSLARRLDNTRIQTIRLDSRNEVEQLSDRKGNQLMTFATMILRVRERVRRILDDEYDEEEAYTRDYLERGTRIVLDVAKRAFWEKDGPGSSHSTAIRPFLASHGIRTEAELPIDAVGFVKLAIDYAHRMHASLLDEVGKMLTKMRATLVEAGCDTVDHMDTSSLWIAYRNNEQVVGDGAEGEDELQLESNDAPPLALTVDEVDPMVDVPAETIPPAEAVSTPAETAATVEAVTAPAETVDTSVPIDLSQIPEDSASSSFATPLPRLMTEVYFATGKETTHKKQRMDCLDHQHGRCQIATPPAPRDTFPPTFSLTYTPGKRHYGDIGSDVVEI